MGAKLRADPTDRDLSFGALAVVFLLWVVTSAVFFSLGFIAGYKEQVPKGEILAERVTTPVTIPPAVSPPPSQGSSAHARDAVAASREGDYVPLPEPTMDASADLRTAPPPPSSKPLSRRAARAAKIKLRAASSPGASKPAAPAPETRKVGTGFTVQVDALRAKQDAEALVRVLKARGYPVFLVVPQYSNSKDNLYRVQVGAYPLRQEAEKVRDKLSQEGFKPFIKK